MERKTISVSSIWTSPNGKIKVIRTPGQEAYYVYKLSLLQYFELNAVGDTREVDIEERIRERDKAKIQEIVNILLDGEPVLKQAEAQLDKPEADKVKPQPPSEPNPQEIGMWWKELGECLRSGYLDETKPGVKTIRKLYLARMLSVLKLDANQLVKEDIAQKKKEGE